MTTFDPTVSDNLNWLANHPDTDVWWEKLWRSLGVMFLCDSTWYAVPEDKIPNEWKGRDYVEWLSRLASYPAVKQMVAIPDILIWSALSPTIPVLSPMEALEVAQRMSQAPPLVPPTSSPQPTYLVWVVLAAAAVGLALVILAWRR